MLEEFKNCIPSNIAVHLNEQKVTLLSNAAVLADEFVLTHRSVYSLNTTVRSPLANVEGSVVARFTRTAKMKCCPKLLVSLRMVVNECVFFVLI